ncbi:hypothetical protein, partial [Aeribacillus composti]|uniref:hypothetical protein n=1 Tax=Aeribacillus composti TaxID=1868734 RepID=UPI002E237B98|nr:hypothetical protein [Aeribacillus composti]
PYGSIILLLMLQYILFFFGVKASLRVKHPKGALICLNRRKDGRLSFVVVKLSKGGIFCGE